MKKLLIYLKDYKKESVLAPLFKMLEASFELIVPLVVTQIIDVGIANRDSGYIVKNVSGDGGIRSDRTYLFHNSAILCGKGSCWIWNTGASSVICSYTDLFFFRN